jgi:hypothetical protein
VAVSRRWQGRGDQQLLVVPEGRVLEAESDAEPVRAGRGLRVDLNVRLLLAEEAGGAVEAERLLDRLAARGREREPQPSGCVAGLRRGRAGEDLTAGREGDQEVLLAGGGAWALARVGVAVEERGLPAGLGVEVVTGRHAAVGGGRAEVREDPRLGEHGAVHEPARVGLEPGLGTTEMRSKVSAVLQVPSGSLPMSLG